MVFETWSGNFGVMRSPKYSFVATAVAFAMTIFSLASCDKEALKLYRDYDGNTVSLIGRWGLVEVQYWTAGVVESHSIEPTSMMEFMENGKGRTLMFLDNGNEKTVNTFYWEKYPGSVTIFTEEEWENNRHLGHDDQNYMLGTNYPFRVIDQNTISCEEKVTAGSWLVNVFARF